MPRKTRIDTAGALHHVIVRGIERSAIFKDDRDRKEFITRLGALLQETSTSCYAWALMNNHVHLLLRSGLSSLSSLMRRLLTGYAQYFNRRYDRSGHLFQNRYKSFLCEEEPYLLELVRYIHLNPLRVGIAKTMDELATFPWSGHSTLVGKRKREWQDATFVLHLFHEKQAVARNAYVSFLEKGIALGHRSDLTGGGLIRSAGGWVAVQSLRKSKERYASDERILGGSDFVTTVLKQANEQYEKKRVVAFDIDSLIAFVCDYLRIDKTLLLGPVKLRQVARARSLIAHIAFNTLRLTGVEIAGTLGLSPSAISKLSAKGRINPLREEIEQKLLKKQKTA
jgi:putative transposase